MSAPRKTLIGKCKDKKLYKFEITMPDNSGTHVDFRGVTFIVREDGTDLDVPDTRIFPTEQDGREWLAGK